MLCGIINDECSKKCYHIYFLLLFLPIAGYRSTIISLANSNSSLANCQSPERIYKTSKRLMCTYVPTSSYLCQCLNTLRCRYFYVSVGECTCSCVCVCMCTCVCMYAYNVFVILNLNRKFVFSFFIFFTTSLEVNLFELIRNIVPVKY